MAMKPKGSGEGNTYNSPKKAIGYGTKTFKWGKGKKMSELIGAKKVSQKGK